MRAKLATYVVFLLVMACGLTACNRDRAVEAARENAPPSVTPAEQDFMMKATQANMGEIELARVALQKSENKDVKAYANMIERDHKDALGDLTDLMKDKNVRQPKTVAAETQQDISRMNSLTGSEFDREFVNKMVSDHQKAVEMFREHQGIAQNPDVKKYVNDVVPKLEMHLDKAQQLQAKLFEGRNIPQKQEPTLR
jgi:putative membrane protein